jgi:hypothetical protein
MSIAAVRPAPDLLRRVVRQQMLTIIWMSIEAVVALVAAWTARSPALLGFGGDSAIELFSGIIVLWRFRSKPDSAVAEKLAARVAGGLLFFVAAFVIVSSGLSLLGYREPQPSFAGDHPVDCGSHRYAVAGKSETEAGNSSCECVIESRCNRIRSLWLPVTDRFGRTVGKPDLSRAVGRPDRGLGPRAAHRERRVGSHPRFATLL